MHVASRESLAAARGRLDEYVDSATPDDLGTLADELFAVADLLDREPTLKRALSDPATEPEGRAGLLDAVFGNRLSPAALDQLRELVRSPLSEPRDLPDVVEALGHQAAFGAAERADVLDDIEDELFRFSRIVDSEPRLRVLLEDARAPVERRLELLNQLVAGKVNPATRRLLDHVVRSPRGRNLETALEDLVKLAAERRERYLAYVIVAAPLSSEQESRLAAALARIYRRAVSLQVEVDPEVIGGIVVRVKDEVIDGSVARRLADARHGLAG